MSDFTGQASGARAAARTLAATSGAQRNAALGLMARHLRQATDAILQANAHDVAAAREQQMAEAMVDRLFLDAGRVEQMAAGLEALVGLPDPVGQVVRGWTTDNGLHIEQRRVPLGVVAIIFEARPNVTADAAGICLKAGNASLLRGSSSTLVSNLAVVQALQAALAEAGLPVEAVNLVTGGREVTDEMLAARGLVDVVIPRGGAGLINHVVANATVPVIETGTGNTHLYVDASADLAMAVEITVNAKAQRPSVCNSLETVLVHRDVAEAYWQLAAAALADASVTVHADSATTELIGPDAVPATEQDFVAEALSLDLSARVVDDIDQALDHIATHSTGHSETIVANDVRAIERFTTGVDAAAVLVNASSRFVDGGMFGFGAEIGISTQKLHARGPMGVAEMTSTTYVVTGQGQVRG